jgi:hypothetical protein
MAPYPHALYDNRGTEVKVGVKVAYNLSGQIGVGYVRDIADGTRHGRRAPIIKIVPDFPEWASKQGESKVRDSLSVLVLLEAN